MITEGWLETTEQTPESSTLQELRVRQDFDIPEMRWERYLVGHMVP